MNFVVDVFGRLEHGFKDAAGPSYRVRAWIVLVLHRVFLHGGSCDGRLESYACKC